MQECENNGAPQERTFVAMTPGEWYAEASSGTNSAQVDDFVARTGDMMAKAHKIIEIWGDTTTMVVEPNVARVQSLNQDVELKFLIDYTKAVKEFE